MIIIRVGLGLTLDQTAVNGSSHISWARPSMRPPVSFGYSTTRVTAGTVELKDDIELAHTKHLEADRDSSLAVMAE